MVGMSSLPGPGACAVGEREGPAEGARDEVQRPAMVLPDSDSFSVGEREAALGEDIERAGPVATPVAPTRLAEVVEEGGHGDTFGAEIIGVGAHMVEHLQGVLSEPPALLVVAVAATAEVVGGLEVVNHGFNAVALYSAED